MKESSFRAIMHEREKVYEMEIEKSKININKLIEESIRDKKMIDSLE